MKNTFIIIFTLLVSFSGYTQDTLLVLRDTTITGEDLPESVEPIFTELHLKGKIYTAMISDGDTLILADLDDVSITSFRKFDNDADYKKI